MLDLYCAICNSKKIFSYTNNHTCVGKYLVTMQVDTYTCKCGTFVPQMSLDKAKKASIYIILNNQNITKDIGDSLKFAREEIFIKKEDSKLYLDIDYKHLILYEKNANEVPINLYRISLCALLFIKTEIDLVLLKKEYNVELYSKLKSFSDINNYSEIIDYIGEDIVIKKLGLNKEFIKRLREGAAGSKILKLAFCDLIIPNNFKNYTISKITNDFVDGNYFFNTNKVVN